MQKQLPSPAGTLPHEARLRAASPARRGMAPVGLFLAMARTSRTIYPEYTPAAIYNAAALFVGQAARWRRLRAWYAADRSPLQEAFAARPALVSVLRRPYIHTGWQPDRRLEAVETHYGQVAGPARALRLEPGAAARLAVLPTACGPLELVLDAPIWFIHEGELSLNLFHQGERIFTIAFSLGLDRGEPVAFVGALQGWGNPRAIDLYRSLTHALHGLRPRDLLIGSFRMLCRELGLVRWLAIGDAGRVSDSAYFKSPQRVRSSYDAAWAEHGGKVRGDGFHDLPVVMARRAHADIPSRKRAAYRQRYEMLDRLEAESARSLQARARH